MSTKPLFKALPLIPVTLLSLLGFVGSVKANVALIGLADEAFPASDHDFQDLAFTASGADLFVGPGSTAAFEAEAGQSMPTGVLGVVDGLVSTAVPGNVTFSYGGPLPAPPATGHGNSTDWNLVYFGSSEAAAIAAGHYFANFTGSFLLNGTTENIIASTATTGSPSQLTLAEIGALDFHFVADITDHDVTINNGATPNGGPAYIAAVPEPGSLALLLVGLLGLGALCNRAAVSTSKGLPA